MLSSFTRSRSKQERLWDACSYGRISTVEKLIADGVNLNWRSHQYECYPIHIASQGKPPIVKMLLDAGCKVDSLDANENTALHHAAMSGHLENAVMLLQAGASVDARNQNDWTPLLNSAYWNHPKVTRVLLVHDADPFSKNKDGRNALHELCRSKSRDSPGLVDNANALLDGMAAWTLHNSDGPDNATVATDVQFVDVRCECKHEWDFEADFTPLLFACYHGHLELVETLLRRGADINATAQNGWTALHWAAQRCHADIVELLLDHGASRSAEDLRGDMPCDVTNDLGLRECLFPDPIYPNIVSNGYATTDEDDSENDIQCENGNSPPKPHLNGFVLPVRSKNCAALRYFGPLGTGDAVETNEVAELGLIGAKVEKLKLAVSERCDSLGTTNPNNIDLEAD
ncbi:hypothetical protein PHET_07906 [Paragonimus heterotremus]|uniref:Uncharacterized protein n=1 Tax=Paragonimus heterotremus TaxID=100268 RepID=A0A8J4WFL6_9TREM|nr:hypothetical protein PHET_07906 [Paragonimus heterotremus]